MSHHVIEFDQQCKSCGGTGLYVGLAERSGAAVVCHVCKGSGCHHVKVEYDDFTGRNKRKGVTRVLQANPGICVGAGKGGEFTLGDFGGMPCADWARGKPFPPGSEMRQFTCPAWWYQTADYDLKPDWDECIGCGSFSGCEHFQTKAKCWQRWDKENTAIAGATE
ncbi:MAG TPA: hypothetical protein VNA25_04065 [Phycisphaerae bacterium]|nr:hypothetical protein [Phycisphaerae bacterium]